MISFSSLGCKLSIHTLGIFIGPREVGQKIEQTHTQTNCLMQILISICSSFARVKPYTIILGKTLSILEVKYYQKGFCPKLVYLEISNYSFNHVEDAILQFLWFFELLGRWS